jgi:outer membrane protein assembly factor BamA
MSSLGGLEEIRGYLDGQFVGNTTIQNNIEYRFDVYNHKWGVIQATLFSDQAKEASSFSKITQAQDDFLISSGVGFRFINPKIYRFVARIDYAQTHTRSLQRGISLGVQQFF